MSAQGNALGAQQQKNAPYKGKSIFILRSGRGVLVFVRFAHFGARVWLGLNFASLVICFFFASLVVVFLLRLLLGEKEFALSAILYLADRARSYFDG